MQYAVKMQQKASEQLFFVALSQFMFLAKQVQSPYEKNRSIEFV